MKLMTASALALSVFATGAVAETHTMSIASADLNTMQADLIRSRDITGGTIYTTNEADDEGWDSANVYDTVGDGWESIGEIEDIVLSRDGQMIGLVAEVGGFLDIGDKHVMVSVDDISLVAVDDQEYAYVTRLNEEDLEALEGIDEGFWD
ncbi:hypothetical protein OG2516_09810 [Oceanicola granulosus HTCC2516]|uniref:PRC-barrel domain-containing protein n=1 Tax=Oceanicola granulosus (strain ATCC BAA-861 / DSM 15982 / KCTC 12143 / HTCC2516) TaxID=314256 RepID=Q2CCU2_OCEGH|nr:PRC-barrel domain-containing protein [Oceanicola granulosus]EAR50531.1 hypothetical protein OG2516_09810 [Oceanicola granulosus HTCC2516]